MAILYLTLIYAYLIGHRCVSLLNKKSHVEKKSTRSRPKTKSTFSWNRANQFEFFSSWLRLKQGVYFVVL